MLALITLTLALSTGQTAAQPESGCTACHVGKATMNGAAHVDEWASSGHAARNVGCHECHGGEPTAADQAAGHKDMLGPSNLRSPVNRLNLMATCSRCHPRIAQAYASTLHGTLADIGDRRAPVCVSCHSIISAPNAMAAEAHCASCHPPGSARGGFPATMRTALSALQAQERRADAMFAQAEQLADADARREQAVAVRAAQEALHEAAASIHRLDPVAAERQTATVKASLDALK
jgi:hypothetical protein